MGGGRGTQLKQEDHIYSKSQMTGIELKQPQRVWNEMSGDSTDSFRRGSETN